MSKEINSSDLFQLKNGCIIMSEELSSKMHYIKSVQPESFQSDNSGYSWDESVEWLNYFLSVMKMALVIVLKVNHGTLMITDVGKMITTTKKH